MTSSRVVRRYAKALFALARERDLVDAISADLERLSQLLEETAELGAVLRHPLISRQRKKQLVARVIGDALHPVTRDLLYLMIDKQRADAAGALREHFEALVRQWRRLMEAEVVTAMPLTEEQTERLRAKLEALTGCQVEIRQDIDESIIGGIIIRVAGKVIDASVSSQLRQIAEALKQVRVTGTRES